MAATQKTEKLFVRATPELREACEAAAGAAGMQFSDWHRAALQKAASERWMALPKKKGGKVKKRK